MRASWLLALLLAAATPGGPGRLAILRDDGRVAVMSGDKTTVVMPPQPRSLFVAWAPAGDRLAIVEEAKLGTLRPFRLIVRSLDKKACKPRQIVPSSQEFFLWREIFGLSWPRAGLITVEGRIDPDTLVMAKIDPRSGALLSTQPGKWFFWSPSGSRLGTIGWIPHFGPEPKAGDRVEIDGKIVYEGAKGNVIEPPLLWSPDGGRLAFIEIHGNTSDLLIAPATTSGALRRFSLAPQRLELLAWSDDGAALLARSGPDYVRLDAATGAPVPVTASDLGTSGFSHYAAATAAAARAAQMGGRASSWWTPPGAAESPKGKTP